MMHAAGDLDPALSLHLYIQQKHIDFVVRQKGDHLSVVLCFSYDLKIGMSAGQAA